MLNVRRTALAAAFIAALGIPLAWGAGMFSTVPQVGQSSFCASNVTGVVLPGGQGPFGISPGSTQGTGVGICQSTVPAGPATYTGTEFVPADVALAGGIGTTGVAQTVGVPLPALGQGALVDNTAVATVTIPATTPWYFLDSAQAGAFTVTMPAAPLHGFIQRIFCTAATVGVLTVAANTGQSLKNNPGVACTAGVGYAWVYNGPNTTWYRFQ